MLDPRGVGEGNIVGGGSWDRGCWPGKFMPMGLWAAAGFICIWLGWLLLIPGPEPCGGGGGGSRGRSGSSSSSEVAMVLMALWYRGVELGMAYLDI